MTVTDSALSLLPPLVAIGLAVLTRRVLLSLGLGILVGALLLNGGHPLTTLGDLASRLLALFWTLPAADDPGLGAPEAWNLSILGFLLLLGAMVALVTLSGGTRAFGEWARRRIRTRRDAQLMTVVLGAVIFIDDYFNSLAVGNVSRPVTDRQGVSRAKLAYLIDSTAAPVCVLMPLSSWGAYLISLIGGILAAHAITGSSALGAFVQVSMLNFYAISALLLVIATAALDLNLGAMSRHEAAARQGRVYDSRRGQPPGNPPVTEHEGGRPRDLLVPIAVLVAGTLIALLVTGAQGLASEGLPFSLLGAFEQTDVALSLLVGGLLGLGTTLALLWSRPAVRANLPRTLWLGLGTMWPAIQILILAWLLTGLIGELGTGAYLAGLVEGVLAPHWLPILLFLLGGLMAFATGTSWGTFGILLPIAGDLAAATDLAMLLPMLGAVLAGAVFGDHCSPISDTTILSSTGAACHHIDHVITQLPYAGLGALVSLAGYLVVGLSGSPLWGLLSCLALLALSIGLLVRRKARLAPQA
ncbi:tetracycline efflux Na+/H+ antiporter family transporter Tet(35) [Bisbaumannia pacifica]|uniref:Tetracycline efflux Na+/H+ antiporter family transporter Tet(35) n=1 Tax=Bisbaumannia pacifica TaxID=77098 RepID=A0A510X5J1_9GAMM|nr:Na+/H+ antiporter NhaC family protein [Halomonas pacifica]GEK46027.1 tetracycline efflux Na+/H+ antiporter family transporter Tet(35) [Halomonas pacifica]